MKKDDQKMLQGLHFIDGNHHCSLCDFFVAKVHITFGSSEKCLLFLIKKCKKSKLVLVMEGR